MIGPATALSILWAVWLMIWLVTARGTARTVARQSAAARLAHGGLIWSGAALLFVQPTRLGALGRPVLEPTECAAWGGVLLAAVGLGFAEWARVVLGRFWSSAVTLKEGHTLIRVGPYALTRHPIYTGLLLAMAGTALARDSLAALLALALIVAGFVVKLRQEERLLLRHFGPAYQAYRDDVPALVPRF